MAKRANTTPFDAVAMTSKAKVNDNVINNFSKMIAEYMEERHGCPFRVRIDHEDLFIVIRPIARTANTAVKRPQRGAIV